MIQYLGLLRRFGKAQWEVAIRCASVALLFLLLSVSSALQYNLWSDISQKRFMLAESRDANVRLKAAASRLRTDLAAPHTSSEPPQPSAYLEGDSATVAAASLQKTVLDILEANAVRVISIEVKPRAGTFPAFGGTAKDGNERPIDLEITFDAVMKDIQKALLRLEIGMPVMVIDGLHLSLITTMQDPRPADDQLLHATLSLHGFWRNH